MHVIISKEMKNGCFLADIPPLIRVLYSKALLLGSRSFNEGIKLECKFNLKTLLWILKYIPQDRFYPFEPVSKCVVVDIE